MNAFSFWYKQSFDAWFFYYGLLRYALIKLLFLFMYVSLCFRVILSDCVLISQLVLCLFHLPWAWNSRSTVFFSCFLSVSIRSRNFSFGILGSNSYIELFIYWDIHNSMASFLSQVLCWIPLDSRLLTVERKPFVRSSYRWILSTRSCAYFSPYCAPCTTVGKY